VYIARRERKVMANTPNFSAPKRPLWQTIAAIVAIVGISGSIGFIVWRLVIPETQSDDVKVSSDIDPSFFGSAPPPDQPIQTPPPITPIATPQPPRQYTPPPAPPPNDLFAAPAVDPQAALKAQIAAINALRAQSSRTMAIVESDAQGQTAGFTHMEGHFDVETAIASDSIYLDRVLTADRMIGALLINEVISDIGGQITAQIEEDIYGFHGRDVLIPRGSRAVGRYVPLQRIGEERLMATWDRIITPEGVNINLRDAQLADTMGRTGGYGDVDRRLAERYGLSILLSTLTAAVGWQMNNQSADPNSALTANTYTTSLADVTGQILREQINVMPRITIPAGSRIFINPIHDVYFPPSSSGTVLAKPHYKGDQSQ
jgi:type IV secretory pathway VirB10-like protein